MIGNSGLGTCYVFINHCDTYLYEHCFECNNSYTLSSDKKSCNFLCYPG